MSVKKAKYIITGGGYGDKSGKYYSKGDTIELTDKEADYLRSMNKITPVNVNSVPVIKESEKVISAAKVEAEKVISAAKVEAEKIISAANKK